MFVCFIWERTLVCKSYNMWLLYCYWLYTIKHSHIGEFKLKWRSAIYGAQPKSRSPKCPGGSENFSSCWRFIDVFLSLPSSVHSPCQLSCFLSIWFWGVGGGLVRGGDLVGWWLSPQESYPVVGMWTVVLKDAGHNGTWFFDNRVTSGTWLGTWFGTHLGTCLVTSLGTRCSVYYLVPKMQFQEAYFTSTCYVIQSIQKDLA